MQSKTSSVALAISLLGTVTLAACTARLGEETDGANDGQAGVIGQDDLPSPGSRFRRLTHAEWQSTALDLLQTDKSSAAGQLIVSESADFRKDPRQGGYIFDGQGDALEVDSSLWTAYQRTASELAAAVVQDGKLIDKLSPDTGTDSARAAQFIEQFGRLAHRRPLNDDQKKTYLELYQLGTDAYEDTPGFNGGIRLVIEALLQSPYFVYRVEESQKVKGSVVPLDGYERANRLSYFFWGTMPDSELMEAAEAGDLDSAAGVRDQALRLIEDARAEAAVIQFFSKVLDVDHYATGISPDAEAFSVDVNELAAAAKEETQQFIAKEIYQASGTLRDFFTSKTSYVNDTLADVYGLSGSFDSTFKKVTLDSDERSGVFTQIGFLASNATMRDPDPIHRGVFMARRINCLSIAAPPDAVPPLPTPNGQSNRQLVTEHTEAEGTSCRNCHVSIINPFGFAFENYDAVGAYRVMDGTHAVDAATEVALEGGRQVTPVQNAVELATQLGNSPGVHECISRHLVAYAQGRNARPEDKVLVEALGSASVSEDASFRSLMVELAVADSFLNRSTEEK